MLLRPPLNKYFRCVTFDQTKHSCSRQTKYNLRTTRKRGARPFDSVKRPNVIGTQNDRRAIEKAVTRGVRVWCRQGEKHYVWADITISKRARRALSTAAGRASSGRSGANRKKKKKQ